MMKCRRGDVVLVEVVFSERTDSKRRPALVISSNEYNQNRQEVIIAAITSNLRIKGKVKSDMISRKLGTLTKPDFKEVQKNLRKSLGF